MQEPSLDTEVEGGGYDVNAQKFPNYVRSHCFETYLIIGIKTSIPYLNTTHFVVKSYRTASLSGRRRKECLLQKRNRPERGLLLHGCTME